MTNESSTVGDLAEVRTWVPWQYAVDFQAFAVAKVAELTGAAPAANTGTEPAAQVVIQNSSFAALGQNEAVLRYPDAFACPAWSDDDAVRKDWIVSQLWEGSDAARAAMAILEGHDGMTGQDIAEAAGIQPKSLPATLRAVAMLCRRVGRRPIWEPKRIGGIWRYWVKPEVRDLFGDLG